MAGCLGEVLVVLKCPLWSRKACYHRETPFLLAALRVPSKRVLQPYYEPSFKCASKHREDEDTNLMKGTQNECKLVYS